MTKILLDDFLFNVRTRTWAGGHKSDDVFYKILISIREENDFHETVTYDLLNYDVLVNKQSVKEHFEKSDNDILEYIEDEIRDFIRDQYYNKANVSPDEIEYEAI